MKVIKTSETNKFENSKECVVFEYPLEDKDINGSIAEISGRYPESGFALNEKCKELVYVIEGSGFVVMDGSEIKIKKGDSILVNTNEKFAWKGKMKIFMVCTPTWYPDQHKVYKK